MKSKNKRVLILGGSSDIGIEVVKDFLNMNWDVTAHYFKNKKKLKKLKNKKLKLIHANFMKFNEKNTEKIISKKFSKKYDALINLVGYVDNKSFENTNLKSIIKTVKINALIPFLIEKKIVNKMLKQKWGRILNCSSIGVKFGGGNNSYNYSLSKHCLEFIPNRYKDWANKNVLINNIRIGVTRTKIHKRMKKNLQLKHRLKLIPAKRMAKPQGISSYIVNLVIDKNSFMTGETITVAGGE